MRISECMSRDVRLARPSDTIQQAAKMMANIDCGCLPVQENDRLAGMITDRDITIRAIAEGKGADCLVSEVMSRDVKYCYEDDDTEDVLRNMGDIKLRRLPVLNRDKRLVGIISLSDLATGGERPRAGEALQHIAEPGGPHSQTLH